MLKSRLSLAFGLAACVFAGCKSAPEAVEEASNGQKVSAGASPLQEAAGSADSNADSRDPASKATLTTKVGKFIGGIAEGVTSTVSSVASTVGGVILGGDEKAPKALADAVNIKFLQLGAGGYRGKVKDTSTASAIYIFF